MRLYEIAGVSQQVLDQVEAYADKLFGKVGVNVEFTRHFLDRLNDERGQQKPITSAELIKLFREVFRRHGKEIANLPNETQSVIKDMSTDINMPFVFNWTKGGRADLVAKTILRKADFKTSNKEFTV